MKKLIYILVMGFILVALVPPSQPNAEIKAFYLAQLDEMDDKAKELSLHVYDERKRQHTYFELRDAFKQIEFLLAQSDKEFYLRYYNGAPLPKLEKNVPDIRVIEPKGMQVLDELLAAEEIEVEEVKKQLLLLRKHIEESKKLSNAILFTDEFVIHAIQYQWIRDYTQGLVGFDTPGSLRAIGDARQSIVGMQKASQCLGLSNSQFTQALVSCSQFLSESKSFETLDRAAYYKEHWQPAYVALVSYYQSGVKTWTDLSNLPREIDPLAEHLFSTTFFNTQAFIDFNVGNLNAKTIALGERLFYDSTLSNTGTMACATCHNPEKAFTDGLPKSKSADGKNTLDRNAPTLLNSIYTKGFFYDLRSPKISQQFEHVVFSDMEFNTSLIAIFSKLEDDELYNDQFVDAFQSHKIHPVNNYTFKTALASYVASLSGYDSEWDKYMRGEGEVSSDAVAGYNLFTGKAACATCHFAPTFAGLLPPYFDDTESEVLGVPVDKKYSEIDPDEGRYSDQRPTEKVNFYQYSFKTTTARHISGTAPYMHNGVFDTLEEVIAFYNDGGGAGHGLDVPYQTLAPDSLGLSVLEEQQLVTFLKTLN
jgi:cytochrome c peroxidase